MLQIGTKVWYRGGWGQDAPVATVITGIGRKNGRVVYDCDIGRWGYAEQYKPRMTEAEAKELAQRDKGYRARQMNHEWVVWCDESDHVVTFD